MNYRYPGTRPFEIDQQKVYFGRLEDIEKLNRLIKLESLVILYAKSGMGKSSLLNAGIIPLVDQEMEYTPVRVRFESSVDGNKEDPSLITIKKIAANGSSETFLDLLIRNESSLWHELKEIQILSNGTKKILLIFDQFEELFTYSKDVVHDFKEQLSEALYAKIPQRYRDVMEQQIEEDVCKLKSEEIEILQIPFEFKIVMAIRSDRMSLLEQLNDFLPTILKHCYELQPISVESAKKAIILPAQDRRRDKFITPSFEYSPIAIDKIINFLTKEGTEKIETTQLQIVSQSIEKKVQQDGQIISENDIGDLELIILNYYMDSINRIEEKSEQLAARRLIEEGLIFEEEERRLSLYEGQIYKNFGIKQSTLNTLVDEHLLRAEPSISGGYTYELSHDTLVSPVLQAKLERKAIEEKNRKDQEKSEREQEMQILRKTAEKETKRRKIANILTGFSIVAFIVALITGGYYYRALKALKTANEQSMTLILQEINRDISHLQYSEAFEKSKVALSLNLKIDTIAKKIQEIAYYYLSIDSLEGAAKTLKIIENKPNNREGLLERIKNISTDNFIDIENRYFPMLKFVQGGTFEMGTDITPKVRVMVDDYSISTTEITIWQYNIFVKATKRSVRYIDKHEGSYPISNITWNDALAYINWLNRQYSFPYVESLENITEEDIFKTNVYRLPTEAEWEFAARGGNSSQKFTFSGSNNLDEVSWYFNNSNKSIQSVKTKTSNEIGIYDMSGNVWEFCYNGFNKSLISRKDDTLYTRGIKSMLNIKKVIKGGSFEETKLNNLKVYSRGSVNYTDKHADCGFRIVKSTK
jgi:formylglycine-generating enzyme required for sulfatase activity